MKILIVSDTHSRHTNLISVIMKEKPELIIHCGDGEGGERDIAAIANCPVEIVRGNCDYAGNLPSYKVLTLGRHRVFVTHGHRYHAGMFNDRLIAAAWEHNCDTVLYGHTHRPVIEKEDGITLVNPGSISFPRQADRVPTYVICDVDDAGELHFTMHRMR